MPTRAYVSSAVWSQGPHVRRRPGALSPSSASQPFAPQAVRARGEVGRHAVRRVERVAAALRASPSSRQSDSRVPSRQRRPAEVTARAGSSGTRLGVGVEWLWAVPQPLSTRGSWPSNRSSPMWSFGRNGPGDHSSGRVWVVSTANRWHRPASVAPKAGNAYADEIRLRHEASREPEQSQWDRVAP